MKARSIPKLHAATVADCWQIAREQAEAYQRASTRARRGSPHHAACLAKRDAADRIALEIRYGKGRGRGKR